MLSTVGCLLWLYDRLKAFQVTGLRVRNRSLKSFLVLFIFSVGILATTCHKEKTQVLVETGPFFGGSISIDQYFRPDDKSKEKTCEIRGNRTSMQSQYLFTFDHEKCFGVNKNSTGIEATLIIQVNREPQRKCLFTATRPGV